jgi:hypothetical protein
MGEGEEVEGKVKLLLLEVRRWCFATGDCDAISSPDTPGGSNTMAPVCQTPHDTCNTGIECNAITMVGIALFSMSPWPSLPPKPSPQVNKRPSAATAAAWNGPHDTWMILCERGRLTEKGEEGFRGEPASVVAAAAAAPMLVSLLLSLGRAMGVGIKVVEPVDSVPGKRPHPSNSPFVVMATE